MHKKNGAYVIHAISKQLQRGQIEILSHSDIALQLVSLANTQGFQIVTDGGGPTAVVTVPDTRDCQVRCPRHCCAPSSRPLQSHLFRTLHTSISHCMCMCSICICRRDCIEAKRTCILSALLISASGRTLFQWIASLEHFIP